MAKSYWLFWSISFLLIGFIAVRQDQRRLSFDPIITLSLLWLMLFGLAGTLVVRPWWAFGVGILFLWGLGYGHEVLGWVFLPFIPLTPLTLTAAGTRRGMLAGGDLMLFALSHLLVPVWWGPWLIATIWNAVLLLSSVKAREALLPATPGIMLGSVVAFVVALITGFG